jgi:serine/threonine-protein kinase RsbW
MLNNNKSHKSNDRIIYESMITASLDNVSTLCSNFRLIASNQLGDEIAGMIDLGLAEALSNIVRHGYHNSPGKYLTVLCHEINTSWKITITDTGSPIPEENLKKANGSVFNFDPSNIDSIPTSGMGLSLIRRIFDEMTYKSEKNTNTMILTKNISETNIIRN